MRSVLGVPRGTRRTSDVQPGRAAKRTLLVRAPAFCAAAALTAVWLATPPHAAHTTPRTNAAHEAAIAPAPSASTPIANSDAGLLARALPVPSTAGPHLNAPTILGTTGTAGAPGTTGASGTLGTSVAPGTQPRTLPWATGNGDDLDHAWRGAISAPAVPPPSNTGGFPPLRSGPCDGAPCISDSAPRTQNAPIVALHGFLGGAPCPATNSGDYWSGLLWYTRLNVDEQRQVDAVDYYGCDVNGVDITHGGGYNGDTPIETIAHDLAWYVYDTYSSKGVTVELVGHSMGGLIIWRSLASFAAHDPTYPPTLLVQDAVTVSSPNAGYDSGCQTALQCREMLPGSSFMTALEAHPSPQGSGGTEWTVMGGGTQDFLPVETALAMPGAYEVNYSGDEPYTHSSYIYDSATTTDVHGLPHALAAIERAIDTSGY